MNAQQDKKHFLNIAEAERAQSSSVWVLNTSNPKGIIGFEVADGMGTKVVIKIPVTWIPIDLTTQSTKATILSSPHFRKVLSHKMVQLVSQEYADSVMDQDAAQKELMRVSNLSSTDLQIDASTLPSEVKSIQSEAMGEVSGFAMNLAMNADIDDEQALNALRGQESSLTKADFQYIAQNSASARVKEYASQKVVSG